MDALTVIQREVVAMLVARLGAIAGMQAVALGGSHARGRARPESDIDLGLYYSEAAPFDVAQVRALAAAVNDTPDPVVTGFHDWGPWVNGGAWLVIGGQRVDFIYRSLEHVGRVIAAAEAGRYELDAAQQAPFGFFSGTYLGETAIARPLFDPDARLAALQRRVATYPEALRTAVLQGCLWQAEFNLAAFAPKFAARGDAWGTAACLARAVHHLVLALFALNRCWLVNDKTALDETRGFARVPQAFATRVQRALAHVGDAPVAQAAAVAAVTALFRECAALAGEGYRPRLVPPA